MQARLHAVWLTAWPTSYLLVWQTHCIATHIPKQAIQTCFLSCCMQVAFYAARYDQRLLGIFPVGDLTQYIPDAEADIAVLEEPEHLTWFHHGQRWSSKFQHVVRLSNTVICLPVSCSMQNVVPVRVRAVTDCNLALMRATCLRQKAGRHAASSFQEGVQQLLGQRPACSTYII